MDTNPFGVQNQVANPQMTALQNQLANLMQSFQQINKAQTPSSPSEKSYVKYVKGVAGAKEFLANMAPNTSDTVFDSEAPYFYPLSKDANGIPAPLKRAPFTIEDIPEDEKPDALTRKDLDAFEAKITNEIRDMLNGIRFNQNQNRQQPPQTPKKEG